VSVADHRPDAIGNISALPACPIRRVDDVESTPLPPSTLELPVIATPAAGPSLSSPVAATPTDEQSSIYSAAFGVLKHSLSATTIAGKDPQRLDNALIGIDAECGITHTKRSVLRRELSEPVCNVYVSTRGAVEGLHNLVLSFISNGTRTNTGAPTDADRASAATTPAAVPFIAAPVSASPTDEQGTVNGAAFGVIEHSLSATTIAGKDSQHLDNTLIGIDAECGITHAKRSVSRRELSEPVCNVHVSTRGAVESPHNLVLSLVSPIQLSHCGRRCKHRQYDRDQTRFQY
jgi:hypothetical protein